MRYAVFARGNHAMRDAGELVGVCFLVADAIECARERNRAGQCVSVRQIDEVELVRSGILAGLMTGEAWRPWKTLPGNEVFERACPEPVNPWTGVPRNYPL